MSLNIHAPYEVPEVPERLLDSMLNRIIHLAEHMASTNESLCDSTGRLLGTRPEADAGEIKTSNDYTVIEQLQAALTDLDRQIERCTNEVNRLRSL